MLREFLRVKISYATVTETNLYYEGSITIDEAIMQKADLLPGEKVEVLNVNNGARFTTYVIKGRKNSGVICLNGPAARQAEVGDKVIILSYGLVEDKEIAGHKALYVELNGKNKVKSTTLR